MRNECKRDICCSIIALTAILMIFSRAANPCDLNPENLGANAIHGNDTPGGIWSDDNYQALLVGNANVGGSPPPYFRNPKFVLLKNSDCSIAHVFDLMPNNADESTQRIFLDEPANSIVIFSIWDNYSVNPGKGTTEHKGYVVSQYNYETFALQYQRAYQNADQPPDPVLMDVDNSGKIAIYNCKYGLCQFDMQTIENNGYYKLTSQYIAAAGLSQQANFHIGEGARLRGMLDGPWKAVPNGPIIEISGQKGNGVGYSIYYNPNGIPIGASWGKGLNDGSAGPTDIAESTLGIRIGPLPFFKYPNDDANRGVMVYNSSAVNNKKQTAKPGTPAFNKVQSQLVESVSFSKTKPQASKKSVLSVKNSSRVAGYIWFILSAIIIVVLGVVVSILLRRTYRSR